MSPLFHLFLLAQAIDTTLVDAASESGALTFGAVAVTLASIVLAMIRIMGPAFANRIKKQQETASERDAHELQFVRKQDELSLEARNFIAEQARENMASVRSAIEEYRAEIKALRDENKQSLTEIGELRALDRVRKEEIENLRTRCDKLEMDVKTQEDINDKLETTLASLRTELTYRVEQLQQTSQERDKLRRLVDGLRIKIWQYRQRLGIATDDEDNLSTDELLGLINQKDE